MIRNSSDHFKGVFYAVLASVMWGVLAIALKVSLKELSSVTIVWARFFIAFIILFVYLVIKRPSALAIFRHPPKKLLIASFFLGLNYYGYMKGLEYTTPGNAQIFAQLGGVLFAMAGIYIFKEKINWKHMVGFSLVLTGMGLFYWEQLSAMLNQQTYSLGILLVIGGSVSWTVYAIYQKELSQQNSTNQLNVFIYGFCTLLFVPLPQYGNFITLSFSGWLLLIFLGLNTLIAYGAIALSFRYLDSSKVSVITTMNPILTFILMYIFEKMNVTWIAAEHFSMASIIGAVIALGGAVFVILFTRKQ
jgi:drug/metabolite transporter (DMT)-like permease